MVFFLLLHVGGLLELVLADGLEGDVVLGVVVLTVLVVDNEVEGAVV